MKIITESGNFLCNNLNFVLHMMLYDLSGLHVVDI